MVHNPIPFTDFGGQGQTLHFLHANGYPPACYFPLVKSLKANFHIIAMHQRPLWNEGTPEDVKDWKPLTLDFLRFLTKEATNPIIAVGHSVGGIVVLRAALLEPHRFRAIVLIDPVLFPPITIILWNLVRLLGLSWMLHPMIPAAVKRRRRFDNLDLVYRGYRSRNIFRNFSDENLRTYIRGITQPANDGDYELVYSPEWEAQIYHTGVWRDLEIWRRLKHLQPPALFIRGAETDTFSRKSAVRVKRNIPDARVEIIPHSGHLVPLERPEEVADLITSFSKELA